MGRFKVFTNGGTVLPGDLDTIEDDYEVAFGTYKPLHTVASELDAPTGGLYPLVDTYPAIITLYQGGVALDPARYWSVASTSAVNPRSVYYNLSLWWATNSTAVGTVTFTAGLYQATGAGALPGITLALAGSPVTGSTIVVNNPAASTLGPASYSGDFVAPSAGVYIIAVNVSSNAAANSKFGLRATLSMRQV